MIRGEKREGIRGEPRGVPAAGTAAGTPRGEHEEASDERNRDGIKNRCRPAGLQRNGNRGEYSKL